MSSARTHRARRWRRPHYRPHSCDRGRADLLRAHRAHTLHRAGFDEAITWSATWHLSYLVIGSTQEQQAAPTDLLDTVKNSVEQGEHPTLAAVLIHHLSMDDEARFTFDIDLMIDGLKARTPSGTHVDQE